MSQADFDKAKLRLEQAKQEFINVFYSLDESDLVQDKLINIWLKFSENSSSSERSNYEAEKFWEIVQQLMRLNRNKLEHYLRGLKAMELIRSTF